MTDVEKLHLIESYHTDCLSPDEQLLIDKMLKEDPEFAQELQDYELLLDGFAGLELEDFESQMQSWEKKHTEKTVVETPVIALPKAEIKRATPVFSMRRLYAVAAAVAILLVASPFIYNQFSAPSNMEVVASMLTSSNAPSRMRGSSDTLVITAEKEAQKKLKETAFEAFNLRTDNGYKESIQLFNQYLNTHAADHEVVFFLGVAKLFMHDAEGASRDLEQAAESVKGIYSAEAQWLQALAQFELGNKDACKRLLNAIMKQPYHEHKDQAENLLKKLN